MAGSSGKQDGEQSAQPKRRRSLRWLVALIIVVALAPTLIGVTGMAPWLLGMIRPELQKAVSFRSASLHWWSAVVVEDIRIRDVTAEPRADAPSVVNVERITTSRPLWQLVSSGGEDVRLSVERPHVNLRIRNGKTNLEDTLELLSGGGSGGGSYSVTVDIHEGLVRLLPDKAGDDSSSQVTVIEHITGCFSRNNDGSLPRLKFSASIREEEAVAEHHRRSVNGIHPRIAAAIGDSIMDHTLLPFAEEELDEVVSSSQPAELSFEIKSADQDSSDQQLLAEVSRVDLKRIRPLLQRLVPASDWSGRLSARIEGLITKSPGRGFAGRAIAHGEDIKWRTSAFANEEWLHLPEVRVNAAGGVAEHGMFIHSLSVTSDVLKAAGKGQIETTSPDPLIQLQDNSGLPTANMSDEARAARSATAGSARVDVDVDLAAFARMMPKTLHIGEGVEIRKADLKASCRLTSDLVEDSHGAIGPPGYRWQLAVSTSDIEATTAGQPIVVDSPLRVEAEGAVIESSPSVSSLSVSGLPGHLTLRPRDFDVAVEGKINPRNLWYELRGLIDLPQPGISGDVSIRSNVAFDSESLVLRDSELQSANLTVQSRSLAVHRAAVLANSLRGDITVDGQAAALRTLLAPWHDMSWVDDDSYVTIGFLAAEDGRFRCKATVEPTGHSSDLPSAGKTSGAVREALFSAELLPTEETDRYQVERAVVRLPGIVAAITGQVRGPLSQLDTQLHGDISYDLAAACNWLLPSQEYCSLAGQHNTEVTISGCPWILTPRTTSTPSDMNIAPVPAPLEFTGNIIWDAGQLMGLQVGPGETTLALRHGLLRSEPIRCSVGAGNLNGLFQWDIVRNVLQLASGSRLENVQLTQEFCRQWLGYVAPMLAGSAEASGQFSIRLQQCELALDAVAQGQVRGTVTVHHAEAEPGESLHSLLQLLSQLGKRDLTGRQLTLPSQQIAVQFERGMVTHDRLEMDLAAYRIVSSGSVGLDESLHLTLQIPLERTSLQGRGRSLSIPVSGTISNPLIRVDGLLQNLGQQELQNRLDREIDRGLNRLLEKLR